MISDKGRPNLEMSLSDSLKKRPKKGNGLERNIIYFNYFFFP